MLLIAQPKSASTALAATIGVIGGLRWKLGIPRGKIDINCNEFVSIQKFHNNMIERSPLFLSQVIKGRRTIFKEHVLPTKRHLKLLSKHKENIVILLRNPEDSLDCYRRLKIKDLRGLKQDLNEFHNRYMWWASNKKNVLVIYYADLILRYGNTIRKVLKHFKLPHKKIIELLRKKYTGVGVKRVVNRTT